MLKAAFFDTGLAVEPRLSAATPQVSVVLPVTGLSGGETLSTIDAVLSQDCRDLELIIVDDGSSDGLRDALRDRRRADSRVAILRFDRPSGLTAHRLNVGVRHAQAAFVAYQFPSVRFLEGGLAALVGRAKSEDAAFVHGGCRTTDAAGAEAIIGGTAVTSNHLAVRNYIAHAGVLHRRDLILRAGLFDPHLAMAEAYDWDMWRRLAAWAPPRLADGVVAEGRGAVRRDPILAGMAQARMACNRDRALAPDAAADCDVIGEECFTGEADRLLFHSLYALPFLGARLTLPELRHSNATAGLLPADATVVSLAGTIRAATVEMAFHNFASTFAETIRVVEYDEHDGTAVPPTADIAVNLRSTAPLWNERRRLAREARQPIVYAMDDDLLGPHVGREDSRGRLDSVSAHLRDADYVIVYAKILQEVVAPLNPRVSRLVMNVPSRYLDLPKPARKSPDGRTEFLIIARVVRSREMMAIADQLRRFFDEHERDAHLTIFANDELLDAYRRVFGALKFDITPLLKYRNFRDWLVRETYDFVINPLRDNPFNRGKSAVKFIEATLAGAVLLTSGTGPYKPIRDGGTGIKVPWRDDAWYEALRAAQAMTPAARTAMHAAAREQLRQEYSTESQYLPFRAVFEAARVHALLRSRDRRDGVPLILADDPAGLTHVLGPYHFRFASPATLGLAATTPAANAETLRRAGIALVHANAPSSPWIAAARRAHIPNVASFAAGPAIPAFARPEADSPDLVLAGSHEGVLALRRARYDRIARWQCPPAPANGETESDLSAASRPAAETSGEAPAEGGPLDPAAAAYVTTGREVAAANLLRFYRAAIERSIERAGLDRMAPLGEGRPRRRVEIEASAAKLEFLGFRSMDAAPLRILAATYGPDFRAVDGEDGPRVLLGGRGDGARTSFQVEADDLQIGFAVNQSGTTATVRLDGKPTEVAVAGETWLPLAGLVDQR